MGGVPLWKSAASLGAASDVTLSGLLLWQQCLTCVVLLDEPMRQIGQANRHFVAVLNDLREGRVSDEGRALINSRYLQPNSSQVYTS